LNEAKLMATFEKGREGLNVIGEILDTHAKQSIVDIKQENNATAKGVYIGVAVIVFILFGAGGFVIRKIMSVIRRIITITGGVAAGDLRHEAQLMYSKDELGQISESVDHMVAKMRGLIGTIEKWTRKRDVAEAVLHSDQGFQYTSQAYNTRLEAFGVKGSHSRKATCLDNACIESFFSHLKTEKLYLGQCNSGDEIHQAVEDYIYFYNYQRFQIKLKKRAPIEYRCSLAA
jgi:putative transposase